MRPFVLLAPLFLLFTPLASGDAIQLPAGTSYVQILGAFAESPVPEPGSAVLVLGAALIAAGLRWRLAARRRT